MFFESPTPAPSARLLGIVDPAHTVVVTMELQKGIVGDEAILPALPLAVQESGLLKVAGRVCAAGRAVGVPILHATMRERPDGLGQAINCKLFAIGAKRRTEMGYGPIDTDRPGVALVDELNVQPTDFEVPRSTGVTPFMPTELNQIIRNLGGKTIVLMGVSLNLGIIGSALSAIDLGYQVVVVRDAVVGLPREYAEAVLQNSIAMIATIVTSEELLAAWAVSSAVSLAK
jgi:nicotinamidase-related amidase